MEILSAREFALLQALVGRPGAILARHELEECSYGWNEEMENKVIDVLIHGLRRRLGATIIRNDGGGGWMVDKRKCNDPGSGTCR